MDTLERSVVRGAAKEKKPEFVSLKRLGEVDIKRNVIQWNG